MQFMKNNTGFIVHVAFDKPHELEHLISFFQYLEKISDNEEQKQGFREVQDIVMARMSRTH